MRRRYYFDTTDFSLWKIMFAKAKELEWGFYSEDIAARNMGKHSSIVYDSNTSKILLYRCEENGEYTEMNSFSELYKRAFGEDLPANLRGTKVVIPQML